MALVKPIIFQVVGYQNSGKTTFLSKLIEVLKANDINTVTIKHHGHGGRPDVVQEKDSTRHLEAGSLASLVEGEGRMVLQADNIAWTLDEQIRLMNLFHPDIIIIEGHKKQPYPKLLILRDDRDISLISNVTNIKAVIVWNQTLMEGARELLEVPIFHILEGSTVTEISKILISQMQK